MTNKVRQSNIELCRIVAMFLVLVTHANFVSLGEPSVADMNASFAGGYLRHLVAALSVVCVNVFVMLSGWFGIKLSLKKLCSFLFQILFFNILVWLAWVVLLHHDLSVKDTLMYFVMGTKSNWFIKAYIALMIIAPVLNMFAQNATKRQYQTILIAFFLFLSLYGWILQEGVQWLRSGSDLPTMAFCYLLAGYFRIYPPPLFHTRRIHDLIIYIGTCLVIAFLSTLARKYVNISLHLYLYTCPFVILASLHFMLFFSKLTITSKVINRIAASVFAVYLLHGNPLIFEKLYSNVIHGWFVTEPTWAFLMKVTGYLLFIYFVAVLIDQVRILLWKAIDNTLPNHIERKEAV